MRKTTDRIVISAFLLGVIACGRGSVSDADFQSEGFPALTEPQAARLVAFLKSVHGAKGTLASLSAIELGAGQISGERYAAFLDHCEIDGDPLSFNLRGAECPAEFVMRAAPQDDRLFPDFDANAKLEVRAGFEGHLAGVRRAELKWERRPMDGQSFTDRQFGTFSTLAEQEVKVDYRFRLLKDDDHVETRLKFVLQFDNFSAELWQRADVEEMGDPSGMKARSLEKRINGVAIGDTHPPELGETSGPILVGLGKAAR